MSENEDILVLYNHIDVILSVHVDFYIVYVNQNNRIIFLDTFQLW